MSEDHQRSRKRSPRFRLRERTAAAHQRVDDLFSRLRLDRHEDYRRFLTAQASAFLPVEDLLIELGIEHHVPGFTAGRRGPLLLKDLADLGVAATPRLPAPALNDVAAQLGAAYVLEGSRLGGAMLQKGVPQTFPARFLRAESQLSWTAFVQILDRQLERETQMETAVSAAQAVFAMFELSAARHSLRDAF